MEIGNIIVMGLIVMFAFFVMAYDTFESAYKTRNGLVMLGWFACTTIVGATLISHLVNTVLILA